MTDKLTPVRRSANMARIRSKNMKPELAVRRMIHQMGYRYRLHRKDLPGKPDMVFPSRKAVIFVHGCFWHLHPGCREGRIPSSRRDYWEPKLLGNVRRDQEVVKKLIESGWRVLIVWECEVQRSEQLREIVKRFLG